MKIQYMIFFFLLIWGAGIGTKAAGKCQNFPGREISLWQFHVPHPPAQGTRISATLFCYGQISR